MADTTTTVDFTTKHLSVSVFPMSLSSESWQPHKVGLATREAGDLMVNVYFVQPFTNALCGLGRETLKPKLMG